MESSAMFTENALQRAFAGLGGACPEGLFARLAEAYTEPARHYHTARHVSECLLHFEGLRGLAEDPAAIEVAIWFHDAVYDARATDNEERSAAWAVRALRSAGCPEAACELVHALVMATRTHDARSRDEALLVDVDLGILGASAERYARYDAEIHLEYAFVPADRYRAGRREVLGGFLARERIYRTELVRERLEAQARANLASSIAALED